MHLSLLDVVNQNKTEEQNLQIKDSEDNYQINLLNCVSFSLEKSLVEAIKSKTKEEKEIVLFIDGGCYAKERIVICILIFN